MRQRDSSSYLAAKMKLNFGRAASVIARHQDNATYLIGFAELFPVEIKFADAGVDAPPAWIEIKNSAEALMRAGLRPCAQKETTTTETVRLHPASPLQCGRWGGELN